MTPDNRANRLLAWGGLSFILLVPLVALAAVQLGMPSHGGDKRPFELIDTKGRLVDEHVFEGGPSLVYYGYTNCPEVCPTTLIELADYLNELGPDGADIRALFFTVDPSRDTAAVLAPYTASISGRILGVTGSPAEMKKAIAYWSIHAEKQDDGADYHMRHTTDLLMIGRDGRLRGMIRYGMPREEAIDRIRGALL